MTSGIFPVKSIFDMSELCVRRENLEGVFRAISEETLRIIAQKECSSSSFSAYSPSKMSYDVAERTVFFQKIEAQIKTVRDDICQLQRECDQKREFLLQKKIEDVDLDEKFLKEKSELVALEKRVFSCFVEVEKFLLQKRQNDAVSLSRVEEISGSIIPTEKGVRDLLLWKEKFYSASDQIILLSDSDETVLQKAQEALRRQEIYATTAPDQESCLLREYCYDICSLKQRLSDFLKKTAIWKQLGNVFVEDLRWFFVTFQASLEQAIWRLSHGGGLMEVASAFNLKENLIYACSEEVGKSILDAIYIFVMEVMVKGAQGGRTVAHFGKIREESLKDTILGPLSTVSGKLRNIFLSRFHHPIIDAFLHNAGRVECSLVLRRDQAPVSPNYAALEKIAQRYKLKYDITIKICDLDGFPALIFADLQRFQTSVQPTCVGYIVAKKTSMDGGHVAPVIGSYCRNRDTQLIAMDVLGQGSSGLNRYIERLFIRPIQVVSTTGGRQADSYSCRIGAITLLRNALLDCKTVSDQRWQQIFERAGKNLPPEWTYGEQVQLLDRDQRNGVAIRDLFSKKEAKRKQPRSLEEHAKKTVEAQSFHFLFQCIRSDIQIPRSLLAVIPPPEGMRLSYTADRVLLSIPMEENRFVNAYLYRKALREKGKIS